MRRFLQQLLREPIIRLTEKYSSRPDRLRVHEALTNLYQNINGNNGKYGLVVPLDPSTQKFIILSDQHKGARDNADIFALSERNYLAALDYYNENHFTYVNLGDSEELWENLLATVQKHYKGTFDREKLFLDRDAFIKAFGNHDLYWDNDPLAPLSLMRIYGKKIRICEGIILRATINDKILDIYLTHGHQGDLQSDGNWFSKWFVANIWGPFQSLLGINPNTPANNDELKTVHNEMMYEWSAAQTNLLLVTGHTHQPVFESLTHLERLYMALEKAKQENNKQLIEDLELQISHRHLKGDTSLNFKGYKPSYFNTGCCCFDDGDITGIEIADGCIRLIKWDYKKKHTSERLILEERPLKDLVNEIEYKEPIRPAKTQKPL